MKVLFIGGSGNISSAVSREAIERGIEVTLLNRGNGPSVPGARALTGDIDDASAVSELLKNEHFDCVVNWIAFRVEDVKRDIRLFRDKCDRYVFISSASVYQKPPAHPIIDESTPLSNPFWEYARDKIACEEHLMAAYRETGFPVLIVRPSLTYNTLFPVALGGWGCWTLADRMLNRAPIVVHGDGTSLWTVTHARDFARGIVPLLAHPQAEGQAFHITSDELLTWNQLYQTMARALGTEANIVHIPTDYISHHYPDMLGSLWGDKAHSVIFDNSKIKRFVPGFSASIPFHQGILETIEWFNRDPARKVINESENQFLDDLLNKWRRTMS